MHTHTVPLPGLSPPVSLTPPSGVQGAGWIIGNVNNPVLKHSHQSNSPQHPQCEHTCSHNLVCSPQSSAHYHYTWQLLYELVHCPFQNALLCIVLYLKIDLSLSL